MSAVQILELPQDVLDSARMTIAELKVEIAVMLYAKGRLSVGKAHELAGLSLWEFRQILGLRKIPPRLDEADLQEEIATLEGLGLL